MNKIVSKPFFAVVLFFVTIASQAKQGPPPPPAAPPVGLPIDGNIYVLLVVSLAFGIYKIYNNKMIKTSK
ncbi:MAG: hypothetical protein O9267_09740 [Flavobacterium sp.]|uniref:hypothetical protein n=1 Tax=Flavobacterium sp. TaxID=239 RepID=UPI0022CAC30F|nr:hypothetical protein [Flavobacterium sp.]MCZ8197876.1 hypothetical protein [Flavobacterium sp.]